eukprot:1156139-Pelagomonas_calceolata.AAC.4
MAALGEVCIAKPAREGNFVLALHMACNEFSSRPVDSRDSKGILWSDKTKALTQVGNPKDFETFMKSFDNYDQIYQMVGGQIPSVTVSATPSGFFGREACPCQLSFPTHSS